MRRDNPWLSENQSYPPRTGNTIYYGETSEAVKAILLAGAARNVIADYRASSANQSNNGLDTRFGSGQLNIYNSYHILAGGRHRSVQDGGTGDMGTAGFDYDPAFRGLSSFSRFPAAVELPIP